MENIQLKTGFDFDITSLIPDDGLDHKTLALFSLFIEKVLQTAMTYTKHTNNNELTPKNIILALQYEAHEFFERPELDEEFPIVLQKLGEILTGDSPDTEDEYDDDSTNTDDEGCEGDSEINAEDMEENSTCECELCQKCNQYNDSWSEWEPTDPFIQTIKDATDKARYYLIQA